MRGILVGILTLIIFGTTAALLWLRERKRIDKITGKLDTYYSMLKERRKAIRLNKRLNVVCKVVERPDNHWSAFSKDISGEGICLYMPEILPQDCVVELEINIPDERRFVARGRVAWVKEIDAPDSEGKRQFSAGIKFTKIKPKDKDVLVNFISASLRAEEQKKGA